MKEIENIEFEIDKILSDNVFLKQKADNMQTIPGIGKTTAVAIPCRISRSRVLVMLGRLLMQDLLLNIKSLVHL